MNESMCQQSLRVCLQSGDGGRIEMTYSNLFDVVKEKIAPGSIAGITSAWDHFLKAIGKSPSDKIGAEFDADLGDSIETYEKELRRKKNNERTIRQKRCRVNTVQEIWLEISKPHQIPQEFSDALQAAIAASDLKRAKMIGNVITCIEADGGTADYLRIDNALDHWLKEGQRPSVRSLDIVTAIEKVLGIPDVLFSCLPELVIEKQLRSFRPERAPTFGETLRTLRTERGLLVPALIAEITDQKIEDLIVKIGDQKLKPKIKDLIHNWERGHHPSSKCWPLVAELDAVLEQGGALLKKCVDGPEYKGRHPSDRTGLQFLSTPLVDAEFAGLAAFKTAMTVKFGFQRTMRWKQDTAKTVKRWFGYFFCWLVQVKGFNEKDLCLALLADAALLCEYVEWYKRELCDGAYNNHSLNFLHQAKALVRPETGYLWQNPRKMLGSEHINRLLPTHEQARRGYGEGRPLASPEERFMVFCEQSYRHLGRVILDVEHTKGRRQEGAGSEGKPEFAESKPSTARVEKIIKMDNPLDALIICLARMKAARPPRSKPMARAVHIRNELMIALLGVYPDREDTIVNLLLDHFQKDETGEWSVVVPAWLFKNGLPGQGAEYGRAGRIHAVVADRLELYLSEARPVLVHGAILPPKELFVSPPCFGRPTGPLSCIYGICISTTAKFIPELAPTGVNPHGFRKIVGTHFVNTDEDHGLKLAATAIKDTEPTTLKYYAFVQEKRNNDLYTKNSEGVYKEREAALRKKGLIG